MRRFLSLFALVASTAYGGNVVLPSDVSVSVQAEPSSDLQPGQPIRLTITVTNNGPVALSDFAVDSANASPDQVDVSHLDTDCLDIVTGVLDGATTYWYIETWTPTGTSPLAPGNWPLAAGESRSCHLTISLFPTAAQSVPFDFHLNPYYSDSDASNNIGRVTLERAPVAATPVPLGSTAALASVALLLFFLGLIALNTHGSLRTRRETAPCDIS